MTDDAREVFEAAVIECQKSAFIDGFKAGQESCPHIITSDEGTSYCNLAESAVKERDELLRECMAVLGQGEHYHKHPSMAKRQKALIIKLKEAGYDRHN